MDVLAPELLWIGDRCYRIPALDSKFSETDITSFRDHDLEEDYMENCEMDDTDEMPDIEVLPNGRYRMVFPVARSFLPFIIGSKGATVKRISKDSSCSIITPRFTEEQNITITGPNKNQVILAYKSIGFVIKTSRQKLPATHFVSIPLISDEIKENLNKLKKEILESCNDPGVTDEIFQNPDKMHLTLTVLILTDEKERKLAEEKFFQVCNQIVKPMLENVKPCILEVQGLDCMNDDPSKVNVLYSYVRIKDHDGLLQELCDKVFNEFETLYLGKEKEDKKSVKIHVTMMNTSFLIANEGQDNEENQELKNTKFKNKKKLTFDATNILKKYKDYFFGRQELTSICLSIRFTMGEDGFYKNAAVFNLQDCKC